MNDPAIDPVIDRAHDRAVAAGSARVPAAGLGVTVRYWAAARAATGTQEESVGAVATVAELLAVVAARHPGERTAAVLAACSVLVDEQPVGRRDPAEVRLPDGAVVDLLPPFAGG